MTAQLVHALPHNYATKSPLVTIGLPKFTRKLLLPIWWSPPPSNKSILQLTPLSIPNSIQIQLTVFHNTLSGQTHRPTHRPTDGIDDRSTPLALTLAILIESDSLTMLWSHQPQSIYCITVKDSCMPWSPDSCTCTFKFNTLLCCYCCWH